ncbi:MAG: hypothetical protein U9R16_03310 [Campylobacterota bacterium]|nr:hypothetical protein [Campylobacterota bacterium]
MQFKDFIFSIILLFVIAVYFTFYPLNVDSTWILHSAQRMLSGATLYIDVVEVNPPLIFIYSIVPILFSEFSYISPTHSYILFVIILILISLYLSWIVLSNYYVSKLNSIRHYLYLIGFILTISISSNFGQREHLLMIFITPFILMMIYRDKIQLSSLSIILIAAFASFGFNIKPHFFLIFIGAELAYMIHSKNILSIFRKDSIIIICSGVLYLLLIFIKFPEYINFAVPMALDTYTTLFNKSFKVLLLNNTILLLFLSILFWFIFTARKLNLATKILFSIIITSLALYLIQQKGWSYHAIPLLISILLFLSYIVINNLKKDSQLYILGFIPIIISIIVMNIQSVPRFYELENILKDIPQGSKVHIISTDIARGQALLAENKLQWASRFGALGILPAIIENKNTKLKEYLFNSLYTDIKKYKPDVIIFCSKYPSFNYYNYFSNNDKRLREIYNIYYKKSTIEGYTILYKHKEIN